MIYDKKFTNNQQFKSSQSALEFSDSLPLPAKHHTAFHHTIYSFYLKQVYGWR